MMQRKESLPTFSRYVVAGTINTPSEGAKSRFMSDCYRNSDAFCGPR